MKRVLGHVLAGLTLLAGSGVVVSACAHDDSTLFVSQVLAPQLVANGNTCVFTSSPTQTFISSGALDLDFRLEYDPTYLVANQMVPRGDPNAPKTETSYIGIQGAVVRITDSQGHQLNSFTRLTSATIPPSTGTTPSYAPVSVTTIDHATLQDPRVLGPVSSGETKRLVTYVRFFGVTLGGQSIESNEFEFPVDVCMWVPGANDCLIQFAPQDINVQLPKPNCVAAGTSASQTLPVPCIRGQDFPIDCSQCQDVAACQGNAAPPPPADAGSG